MSSRSSAGRNKLFNSREKAQKTQKEEKNRIAAKERKERKDTEQGQRLWAEPDPDRGATFQFTLPLDAQDTK